MAMGLCNAPATFQTLMNSIFGDVNDEFVVTYVDDILIFSRTGKEHRLHIREILRHMKQNELFASPKNAAFFRPKSIF